MDGNKYKLLSCTWVKTRLGKDPVCIYAHGYRCGLYLNLRGKILRVWKSYTYARSTHKPATTTNIWTPYTSNKHFQGDVAMNMFLYVLSINMLIWMIDGFAPF